MKYPELHGNALEGGGTTLLPLIREDRLECGKPAGEEIVGRRFLLHVAWIVHRSQQE
jgi:hypothetical protein